MRGETFQRIWDEILEKAATAKASDIHLEPHLKDGLPAFRLRLRRSQNLATAREFPAEVGLLLIDKLKSMADLDVAERRAAQDGRLDRVDLGCDFRVSLVPCLGGEKAVLRLLPKNHRPRLSTLGIPAEAFRVMTTALAAHAGLIVVAGATGSGKTTTLHALLAELDSDAFNIVTLEDPVEYRFPGLTQIPVTPVFSFARGLRALLRQDPDVILVGEIRDEETAKLALEAAGTGHLVLTSLHANSAEDVPSRLRELGCDADLLNRHLRLALFQRLVPMNGKLRLEMEWRCERQ